MSLVSLTLVVLAAAPVKLSSVVVYPDRALVTRVETVPCSGHALAVFDSVPPAADPSTFHALSDTATVESLVTEEHTLQNSFGPELETLRGKREPLERELQELEDARARGEALGQLGERYTEVALQRVTRELSEPRPDTRAWTQAFDTALETRLRAAAEVRAHEVRLREVRRQLETLRARESFLASSAARLEQRVEVRLACASTVQARVELQYVVSGAGWTPVYEARADEGSGQVELSTFATVSQTTGEDWNGVRLALSTARPRADAAPPQVTPLTLSAWERAPERKVLVRRDERQEHAQAATTPPATTETEGELQVVPQGISVQLTVPEPAQVRGEGTQVRLRVARTMLKASFLWRTVPKLRPVVFRVARLVNGAPFPLLPGPVELFLASGFIGRQALEYIPQGAPFQLTFGVEESLRVERTVVDELVKEQGLFGGKQRFRYAYRLDLANYRPGPEEIEVTEQLPVSELEDVKVALEEKTTPGHEVNAAEGFISWRVKLAPAEKRSLELAFHVDVPSGYDTGHL